MSTTDLGIVLALLSIGFLSGIVFDRLILWPLASFLSRQDGRREPPHG